MNPTAHPLFAGINSVPRTLPSRRLPARGLAVLLALTFSASLAASGPHPVASPDSYELHPDLELSLFAREPDVVDPVALAFDEFGRCFVVEMRDYPYGFAPGRTPGGTLRLLEDTDGDGRADRSTVFADALSFPTSVLPWNQGVLVVAPPDVLYLKDTDADGRADVREILLSGLKLGVTDSNANGLRWGLDNWIHAVNGGNGGLLVSLKNDGASKRLGDRDFRFHPETGVVDLTAHTGGGFGLVFDDWGNSFTPYNIDHIRQRIADADAFSRYPDLPPVETTLSISDHGDMARIFAISTAVTRPNHPEQAGHFSSAGGMGFLGHRGWPGDLPGSVLVCDVVGNLVHRDVLSHDGPILKASRPPSEQSREFFASRDPGFRPTGIELGPDGALYLMDMQRDVIEHPDYIPKRLLDSLDLRAGDRRGRIYRIAPKGWPRTRDLPGTASVTDLVRMLSSPNQWTRLTAQRLLVSRKDRSAIPSLKSLRSSPDATARLHALRTLDGLGALEEMDLLQSFSDSHPAVRSHAVSISEDRFRDSPTTRARVVERITDDDAHVRFVALLALGAFPPTNSLAPVLATFDRDRADSWMRRAVLAAIPPESEFAALQAYLEKVAPTSADSPSLLALRDLADLFAARLASAPEPAARLSESLVGLLTAENSNRTTSLASKSALRLAVLQGLVSGLQRARLQLSLSEPAAIALRRLLAENQPSVLVAAWRLARLCQLPDSPDALTALASARRTALDRSVSPDLRTEALAVVDLAPGSESVPTLLALLDGREPSTLQQAALGYLRERREPSVGEGLIRAWPSLTPSIRSTVVNLLVYRPAFHASLLAALESGSLPIGELNLDLEHRRQLLRHASSDIRQRAAKLMSDEEYSNRQSTVDNWLARLPATGEAARGRPVFERLCAQCHRVGSLGFNVGPDLTGMSHRSVEDLASNILDPNMAMNPAFVAFTAELSDGESESGILGSESADAITLIQAMERKVTLRRSDIRQLKSGSRSLMPEGLEAGFTPQELRDLISFLHVPRSSDSSKP